MKKDGEQIEFPFVHNVTVQRLEALSPLNSVDCSADRHRVLPNGTCMLCRKQVHYGIQEEADGR